MAYIADNAVPSNTTESSPYIPQTYNDLLAAIGTYGAYVKINKDFDFSQSSEYKVQIPEVIYVRCAKLFADDRDADGNKYMISGINCGNLEALLISDGYDSSTYINPQIDNIALVNCVYRCSSNNNLYKSTNGTNTHIQFTNSQISVLVICQSIKPSIDGGYVTFENCSEYYKFIQSDNYPWDNTGVGIFGARRTACTIQFTGLKYSSGGQFTQYVAPVLIGSANNYMTNCTFYGDVKCIPNAENTWVNIASYQNCCFAISFTKPDGYTISLNSFNFYNSSTPPTGTNIMDSTIANCTIGSSQNPYIIPLTTTQMKDENELISIGFLP